MSISSIDGVTTAAQQSGRIAADGDPAAVEARETRAQKHAEALNGGFEPKPAATSSVAPSGSPSATGALNQIA